MVKQVVTTPRMLPVTDAVPIPMVRTMLDDDGFHPNDIVSGSATVMLDELVKVGNAMTAVRAAG
jgi:hypothetical protein